MEFNELLIEYVRDHPSLYDWGRVDYKDARCKRNAWIEISKNMGQPVEACTRRWKSLRDRFVKEKKKVENAKSSGTAAGSTWEYYESLQFLHDFLRQKLTIGNVPDRQGLSVKAQALEEICQEHHTESHSEEDQPSTSAQAEIPVISQSKKRKHPDTSGIQEPVSSMFKENIEATKSTTSTMWAPFNEYEQFGNIVVAALNKMPQTKAYESMAAIMQVISSQMCNDEATPRRKFEFVLRSPIKPSLSDINLISQGMFGDEDIQSATKNRNNEEQD